MFIKQIFLTTNSHISVKPRVTAESFKHSDQPDTKICSNSTDHL